MGTSALIRLQDHTQEIASLYVQCDGYPTGVGADIKEALGGKTVVNGYSTDDQINGAGDMAVQLIAFLKHKTVSKTMGLVEGQWVIKPKPVNTPGTYYLLPPGNNGESFQYVYTLVCPALEDYRDRGKVLLKVESGLKLLFEGCLEDFSPGSVEDEEDSD